jgi:RimJ/RimL family protein N-acetyltransferase
MFNVFSGTVVSSCQKDSGLLSKLPRYTNRLKLRLFQEGDAGSLYELHRDNLLTRYAGGSRTRAESIDALQRMIRRTQTDGLGPLAIEEIASGELIGWCGVQKLRGTDDYEVIYALRPARWGRGFATEAAAAVIAEVAELEAPMITELWGIVFPQNLRSIRVLEKLGMRFAEYRFDEVSQRYASAYLLTRNGFITAVGLDDRYSSRKK